MASYNKVILMGNLVRDPELGSLPNNQTAVCEFTLAVNRRWKDSRDEVREETLFIDCTAFGKQATAVGTHLQKGRPLHLEGHLKLDTWEAQDGTKRSKIRVIVEQFRFLDSGHSDEEQTTEKSNGAKAGNGAKRNAKNGKAKRQPVPAGGGDAPEGNAEQGKDIPF